MAEDEEKLGGSSGTAFTINLDGSRPGGTVVLGRNGRLRPASASGPRGQRPKSMLHVNSSFMKDFSSLDQKASRLTEQSSSVTDSAQCGSNALSSNNGNNLNRPKVTDSSPFGNNSTGSSIRSHSTASSAQLTSPPSTASSSTAHLPPFGMQSMPPLFRARGPPSEAGSDVGSTFGSTFGSEYNGPKLFVKPCQKTNRIIILNAINSVLAGTVNAEIKKKCLEVRMRDENSRIFGHFYLKFAGF